MSRKDKIVIVRDDDFAEVEDALASAMNQLDDANTRIEALLAEQTQTEEEGADDAATPQETPDGAQPETPASDTA